MIQQDFETLAASGADKLSFMMRGRLGFFVSSMLAGLFVSLGAFVAMTIGGLFLEASLGTAKLLAAFAFSSALSLVVMAGCELFTGHNLTMGAALFGRRVTLKEACEVWLFCWLGNFAGSWLSVLTYWFSGAPDSGLTLAYFDMVSSGKVSLSALQLILRGVLCNICVCLAVWCSVRMESEAAKLIIVFWCILVFMICGFEHSVANMSIVGVSVLHGQTSILPYAKNLLFASLGNLIGGTLFVAVPYYFINRERKLAALEIRRATKAHHS